MSVVFRVWRDSGRQFTGTMTRKDFTDKQDAVEFARKHADKHPNIEKITTEPVTGWETP